MERKSGAMEEQQMRMIKNLKSSPVEEKPGSESPQKKMDLTKNKSSNLNNNKGLVKKEKRTNCLDKFMCKYNF